MKRALVAVLSVASLLASAACSDESDPGGSGGSAGEAGAPAVPALLVFSRTTGYRHDSIPAGIAALSSVASERGFSLSASEDAAVFSDSGLEPFDVIVFLSTTGEVLDAEQQGAFERFIRAGGGWVGIHSASDTEYDWPFYGDLVGAYFREHPAIQEAVVHVEDATHPATRGIPSEWRRTDEWYAFGENPRPNVSVLLTLDETTYAPGTATMGADHPMAWYHEYEGGRAFYTALGHTSESYAEPAFLGHLEGAIEWAAGP
jgi:type 1 glutamine amidotransferase